MTNYQPIDVIVERAVAILKPPPDLTVSEWADEYRKLSPESSAMPGVYRVSVTEYMREPMDMATTPGVKSITLKTSAQVGKSTFIENIIGYFMHYDPCPILHVSPTLNSMKMFSKERLSPMLRDTPVLKGLVKDARSRDSDNTIDTKKFPGGNLAMVGSNAPAGLASRPVRIVLFDEVDRFELSAGTEGDPISLAKKRSTTYWNALHATVTTPGDKDTSRIEDEFQAGDQRHFHVPCPHCGLEQPLQWANVRWHDNNPMTAYYVCDGHEDACGGVWNDQQRNAAVKKGRWVAEKPFNGHVSYHLNQLYSPFAPLSDGVRDFLQAKGNSEKLKTWVNTFLGEVWEERGDRLEHSDLMDRREEYETEIPVGVTMLTAAVDVQDDRFEYEVLGWGDNNETWSIEYGVIYGDLSTKAPWDDLRAMLKQAYHHPWFGEIAIRGTCIDTGGHFTRAAYAFTKTTTRVFAIKGVPGEAKPMVGRPTRNNIGKIQLFPVGVDTIKEVVTARLKVEEEGVDGYCHFPAHYGEDYFLSLTAEKLITKYHKGRKRREWTPIRKRNEAFDLRVYNLAAMEILDVNLEAQRRNLMREYERAKEDQSRQPEPEKPYHPTRRKRKPSSWADRWKHD